VTAWLTCSVAVAALCVFGQAIAGARGNPELAHRLRGGASAAYAIEGLIDAALRDWVAVCISLACAAIWFWL
jgi:hypothetical protein